MDVGLSGAHPLIVESLVWPNEEATLAFANQLAQRAALRNALVELHGDLGAGKTSFVRHLLRSLGVQGRVKSPSYAVVEPYTVEAQEGILSIWHFDLYRFANPREFEEAGFRDILASPGLKLVEWPGKGVGVLPQPDLAIHITAQTDESRHVRLEAFSPIGKELLA